MNVAELCLQMDALNASDLFLTVGRAPVARIMGDVKPVLSEPLQEEEFLAFLGEYLPPGITERFRLERDLDLGVTLGDGERFRLNLYYQRGCMCLAVRRVPSGALGFEELFIPDAVRTLAESPRGLILITGATGSGKSTTMAALLHYINTKFARHIVTIEDPIEFTHADRKSVISQREIGTDTTDFSHALKAVVRQNPDCIFIGEMRDFETIRTAISAAMTGHLVVSTMHTIDVEQTLDRIINYFPADIRNQVSQDFAMCLRGIISQRLLPRCDVEGRIPAFEILVATPLVRRLIAKRELEEVSDILKTGTDDGMQTFTSSLVEHVKQKRLTLETAAAGVTNREEFYLAIQGMVTGTATFRSIVEETNDDRRFDMKKLLRDAVKYKASDLLLTVGSPPMVRLDGSLRAFDMPILTASDTSRLLFSLLTPAQRATFEAEREIDFSLSIHDRFGADVFDADYRFRVNGFYQRGSIGSAFRMIPQEILPAEELHIPAVVCDLAQHPKGLVLVTGPTGHGKSTTLASLIDAINKSRPCHIITIEDPIEFVHENNVAVIEQREVKADTLSFNNALKYVLRQDPDVILIGEMRDPETITAALTAAETGHLVFATLHTNDATQAVDRIIDVFPAGRQNQIRTQLAACLEAVVAQRLLPHASGKGRIAAFEVMLGTVPIRALIRDNRTHQLKGTIETASREGMITLERYLKDLLDQGFITRDEYRRNITITERTQM